AKKILEKDKLLLQRFLDTIFYTCSIIFNNTCDLAMTILPNQNNNTKDNVSSDKDDNEENINKE
ncbi:8410_t:CDS:1, partial [Scutellospora calospora]